MKYELKLLYQEKTELTSTCPPAPEPSFGITPVGCKTKEMLSWGGLSQY